mmetsp:Transcript_23022/g.57191  ORF Transcript_23022/g.57191 Transcript_23022/m.57191 type:complete len:263 (+) Transcript_23022:447-1235(+)
MPKLWSHTPSRTSYRKTRRPVEPSVLVATSVMAVTWRLRTMWVPTSRCKAVSSWKWVAKRHAARIFVAMCSAMAKASPKPSYVDVPRPSSSMMTRDEAVARRMMAAVSSISDMNVETPSIWLSPAPTLARIQSVTGMLARVAGTKPPMCASKQITPTCRIYVLLPPMLGPVTMTSPPPDGSGWSSAFSLWKRRRSTSFAMNCFPSMFSSTIGWRPFSITKPERGAVIVGRQNGSGAIVATVASAQMRSSSAIKLLISSKTDA